jgi:hypothetical protein
MDGPAVECPSGHREYYFNGKRHRVDGPAIEYANGDRAWYEEGKQHSPQYLLNSTTSIFTPLETRTPAMQLLPKSNKPKKDDCSLA